MVVIGETGRRSHELSEDDDIGKIEDEMIEEFCKIRVFPMLVEARKSGGYIRGAVVVQHAEIQDRKTNIAMIHKKKKQSKKPCSLFRSSTSTKESYPLAHLRKEIQRKRELDKLKTHDDQLVRVGNNAIGHKYFNKIPFRPANASSAKRQIAAPMGQIAKNPFNEYDTLQKNEADANKQRQIGGRWRLSSTTQSMKRTDCFLHSADAETITKERVAMRERARQNLIRFNEKIHLRNAAARNRALIGYYSRLGARPARSQATMKTAT